MSPLPILLIVFTTPWADTVITYDAGVNPAPGYTNPQAAIGTPSRFTGEGIWPGVVSPFNAPWLADEIVSIGAGGELVLSFDAPIQDDPNNPWGIDLIVFGNTSFIDDAYPSAIVGGVFSDDGGTIEVSTDGKTWVSVTNSVADGLWPTCGFTDSQPYDPVQGTLPSNFLLPIDPRLTIDDVMLMDYASLLSVYANSGGGTGIDLAQTGLPEISYIRISVPVDAKLSPEIDAVADVAPQLQGDVNMDGIVDINDLLLVIAYFGPLPIGGPLADFNGDLIVDVTDLLVVIGNWS
jgi:hypothetical protein